MWIFVKSSFNVQPGVSVLEIVLLCWSLCVFKLSCNEMFLSEKSGFRAYVSEGIKALTQLVKFISHTHTHTHSHTFSLYFLSLKPSKTLYTKVVTRVTVSIAMFLDCSNSLEMPRNLSFCLNPYIKFLAQVKLRFLELRVASCSKTLGLC